jgi:hypothetical protein
MHCYFIYVKFYFIHRRKQAGIDRIARRMGPDMSVQEQQQVVYYINSNTPVVVIFPIQEAFPPTYPV